MVDTDNFTGCIVCNSYGTTAIDEVDPAEFGQVAKIFAGTCSQSEAREFYDYTFFGEERDVSSINSCYPIKLFLENHKL